MRRLLSFARLRRPRSRIGRLFLTRRQFDREVHGEWRRAARRGIPFCVITIQLTAVKELQRRSDQLARVLLRHVRSTDEKGMFSRRQFAVLLVDTAEMGGRTVIDRLQNLLDELSVPVEMELKVYDPNAFDPVEPLGEPLEAADCENADATLEPLAPFAAGRSYVSADASPGQPPWFQGQIKRLIDLVGAVIGLVGCAPILVLSAIAIRCSGPGPIFYRQTREGLGGKPFTIYKLRTMVVGADALQEKLRSLSHRDGPAFKIERDPRVTAVGRILRATCIDELPQLWNVLKGEMSLVGPRPLPWRESRACNRWHRRRLDVLPGLTCYWQVNKAAAKSFDEWMRMDLAYVDRRSLWTDLALVYRTFAVALSGRGGQ